MSFAVTPNEIRAFRAERGWSQAEFAAQVAVKKRTVEDWEGGRRGAPEMLRLALHFIRQRESLQRQLELMKTGAMTVRENGQDATQDAIALAEAQMAEFERLLNTPSPLRK